MNQRWRWWVGRLVLVSLLTLGCLLVLAPDEAFGRAGGGGGYHSSGGGSSGSHSSGSGRSGSGGHGDGVDIGWLIYLLFRYPHVSVPLVIAVVIFFWYSSKQGNAFYQSGVIRRGTDAMAAGEKAAAVGRIRAHDRNFDEAAFCARVGVAFNKIQDAWCGQDLVRVRPFISDGVYERFLLQIDEQKAQGYRDHMEDVRVDAINVVAASTSGVFDEASVRIAAVARDWRESLADGKRIQGSSGPEPFVEVWTFLRRRGAVTAVSKSGLIEGNCPNCGASVEMNQSARCTHCKAELRSGEYDWVLTEITQEVEWSVPRRERLPGVEDLRQRDPGFDPASIEDRASVMFWRRATADRTAKIDPLRKIALPAFADAYAAGLKGNAQPRRFAADCAVGSVQTLGVTSDGTLDRAIVEIRWSGKRFVDDGRGPRTSGEALWASELFVLAKQANAKTDAGKNIASAHCPNCGAPESGGKSNACDFCGTVLNDGAHGWVLEQVAGRDHPDGRQLMAALAQSRVATNGNGNGNGSAPAIATPDSMGLLAWLVRVATSDGNVAPDERQMLADVARHRNVPAAYVESMIQAGLRGDLAVSQPADRREANQWVEAMAEQAWADGQLTNEELGLLRTLGQRAGLSDADVTLAVRRGRATIFNRVKQMRRNA